MSNSVADREHRAQAPDAARGGEPLPDGRPNWLGAD